jgi:hypothetical protein
MSTYANESILDARLAAVRGELESLHAPGQLETALAAHFRRAQKRPPRLWWMPPLALAATLAIVSWMIRAPLPPIPKGTQPAAPTPAQDPGPFLALKPLERIALEPGTTIVESEFPRALLAEWGLPVAPDRAGEPVRAEMLYSPNGEALAVRLIQ